MKSIAQLIAEELNVRVVQVEAAVALLDDKATVPFIARYRKEATGGLDDTQLRGLEGVVTNVANFGAFVDIGVHQDGLVHVSQLADRFVKDPREVVKAGDIVKVRVVEVDIERKRIALTMKSGSNTQVQPRGFNHKGSTTKVQPRAVANTAFGAAFAKLSKDR